MTTRENPYAGQGPVLLDIGGDVGALIVTMPAEAEGLEVEIRPRGATAAKVAGRAAVPHRHHDHDHDHARTRSTITDPRRIPTSPWWVVTHQVA